MTRPAALTQTEYDAANEQIRFNSATPNLVYDNNGNLTSFTDGTGTTTYTWNARNRLTAISGPGLSASFVYDGLGRRNSKTVNSATTGYWYDGADVLAELSGSTPTATYVRSLAIDEPFIRKGASDEFYQTDALGSSVALTDGAGAGQTTYTYDPFGKTTVNGTSTNALQYTGRENDGTDLYYYRGRYYNPTLKRFISEDRVNFKGSSNRYVYVRNNPLKWIDPFGLWEYAKEYGTTGAGLTENMAGIEAKVDSVFNGIANRDGIVTYTTNGEHKADSLHYEGSAIDLRTRDLMFSQRREAVDKLRKELGPDYDVIDEGDHIHIEYDPKGSGGDAGGGSGEGGGGGSDRGSGGRGTSGGMGTRK